MPANVSVHERDLATLWLPHRPFRVVANLPFTGSNEVIRRLLARGVPLLGADLVVELGVARRWVERRPDRCTIARRLAPTSFVPPPSAEAAVLRIRG